MEKRKLNPALRKKLLGLLPFSKDSTIDHIPAIYLKVEGVPEDSIPVFTLRGLSREDANTLRKMLRIGQSNQSEKTFLEFIRKSLTGWKNFFDVGTCEEIEFVPAEDGGASQESMNMIPEAIASDLLMAISAIGSIVSMEKLGLK